METYTVFTKKKVVDNASVISEDIKSWLIDRKIIQPAQKDGNVHYADTNASSIVDEDWDGHIEFLTQREELIHVLGWDWGADFLLPEKAVCPQCNNNLIEGIDAATFYGEANKKQNPDELNFLQLLEDGIKAWNAGEEVSIRCHCCHREIMIENFNYNNGLIFTNLAIIFWNWPTLKEEFQIELRQRLGEDVLVLSI